MYENVGGLKNPGEKRGKSAPPLPPTESPLMAGLQRRAPVLCLILLVLCLALGTMGITLAVKYIKTAGDLQDAESRLSSISSMTNLQRQTQESLLNSVREELEDTKAEVKNTKEELNHTKEELNNTKEELNNTKEELEKMSRDNNHLTSSLLKSKQDAETCATLQRDTNKMLEDSKQELRDVREELNRYKTDAQKEIRKDICPEGWQLYKQKCLWISTNTDTWDRSKSSCQNRESNLIVVPKNDKDLRGFLSEKRDIFWVGQEWSSEDRTWKWPSGYPYQNRYYYKFSNGDLGAEYSSSDNKYRFICEKTLVATSRAPAYGYVQFTLSGKKFSCWGN